MKSSKLNYRGKPDFDFLVATSFEHVEAFPTSALLKETLVGCSVYLNLCSVF